MPLNIFGDKPALPPDPAEAVTTPTPIPTPVVADPAEVPVDAAPPTPPKTRNEAKMLCERIQAQIAGAEMALAASRAELDNAIRLVNALPPDNRETP